MTIELILLGTGAGVTPKKDRTSPAAVLCVGSSAYLIDCSSGVAARLVAAGVLLGNVKAVFTTHHHLDHVADVGIFSLLAWSQISDNIHFFGISPLKDTIQSSLVAHQDEIKERIEDEGRAPIEEKIIINEIESIDSTNNHVQVYQDEHVTVSACEVDHPPMRALAYRFDFSDTSIVFSGDTSYCPALADFAQGADYLMHEAFYQPALENAFVGYSSNPIDRIKTSHTSAEGAAKIAAIAGVKTLVLSPVSPSTGVKDSEWIDAVSKTFDGNIVVGQDQMKIKITNLIEE